MKLINIEETTLGLHKNIIINGCCLINKREEPSHLFRKRFWLLYTRLYPSIYLSHAAFLTKIIPFHLAHAPLTRFIIPSSNQDLASTPPYWELDYRALNGLPAPFLHPYHYLSLSKNIPKYTLLDYPLYTIFIHTPFQLQQESMCCRGGKAPRPPFKI